VNAMDTAPITQTANDIVPDFPLTHKTGLEVEDAERYAKLIFFCMLRGDFHAATLWLRKANESLYDDKDVPYTSIDEMPIAESRLDIRLTNALEGKGYLYFGDLINVDRNTILKIKQIGVKGYNQIISELTRLVNKANEV